ncbi:MAG: hypothetical protein A3K66_05870 [Euryarchaeota archaeon RBG_16_67_27]|nr:MAG: hypothetical protein A3K66_05870 [Euryarchaeota archaeon RBG_16_67_27]
MPPSSSSVSASSVASRSGWRTSRTRRKVYVLGPPGQEIARRMRDHARERRVLFIRDGARIDVSGAEAIDALRREGVRESEAVSIVLSGDVVAPPRKAAPPAPPPRGPPFVGRESELRALGEWLATEGQPVAVVVGVAGIGKSALLARALETSTRPSLMRRVYAHDDTHGLLASVADFLARQGRRRLKVVVSRPAYDLVEAFAVLRQDLGGSLLALDDAQASPAADGLVRGFLEGDTSGKLLVGSRVRPTSYDARDTAAHRVAEVSLDGLDPAAAAALLSLRAPSLDPPTRSAVLRAARGHPLSLELFAAVGLAAGEAATERYILETILEGLDDASEGVLRTFAVLRRPAVSPEALGATVAELRRLVRTALLQHREDGYVLHDLIREFFLARMGADARARANAVAARYWESRGDPLESAHHRLEAGDVDGAAELLAANGAAHAESARAGDLEACLVRLPPARRPARLLAETRMFLGKFAEAREELEPLAASADPRERLRASIDLGRIANRLGDYARARGILEGAVRDAGETAAPDLEGEAYRALGGVERRLGDLPAALEHLTRAVGLLGNEGRERVRGLLDLSAALIAQGDLAAARTRLREAEPLARNGSREAAAIENNLAIVLSREGHADEAAKAFARAADLAIRTGEMRFASYALANAADNLLRLDDANAAAAAAERALSLAASIRDPLAESTAQANLGLVHARRGEWAKAEAHLLGSVELIAGLDNPYSLGSRCEAIARLYEAQGRTADAAPWRERAEAQYARLRGAPPGAPSHMEDVRQSPDQTIK